MKTGWRFGIFLLAIGFLVLSSCSSSEMITVPASTKESTTNMALTTSSPGRLLASQCAQCHGTDGISTTSIDELAGEDKQELIEEMLEFQMDDANHIMVSQARGYTLEQITLIAEYFSQIEGKPDDDEDDD